MANPHKKKKKDKKGNRHPLSVDRTSREERKDGRPYLSVCMIVRNEEKHLERCLKSIKDIADEIVVVDTGSEDRTVSIAKKYTNRVYFHPWNDSFSEARNHYLGYARGEWIFQIDADEELVQEDIPALREAIREGGIDAIMVQIVSHFKNGKGQAIHSVERIFRNNGVIHYEGRVHNRLVGIKNAKVFPVRLIHHGYDLGREKSREKSQRTLSLLKMDLQDNPHEPLTYHYLSCCYMGQGMWREALDAALRAIRLAEARDDGNPIYLWSHCNAAMSCYRLGELERAKDISLSALKKFPDHIDSHFLLGLVCFDQGEWARLIEHGSEYLALLEALRARPERFGTLVTNSLGEEWNMLVLMGFGYFELGRAEKAHEFFEKGIGNAPDPFLALRAIGIYFSKKQLREKALPFLRRALKENPNDPTVKDLLKEADRHGPPDSEVSPTISCCMIVKDEEAFLEQCLESVKDYVDEIIIVDTGSQDRTMEIARRYTDKVYSHPWEGSFSKARNQALTYASCDWIFQIDADEELLPDSGPKLRQAVREAGKADAILVNIISTYSKGAKKARHNFERLFRNNGVIHYEGIVHNRVEGASCIRASKIELMHYGYDVEEKKAHEKFLRTTELLKKQIQETPDDPMPHHYLGTSYLSRGMNEEAAKEATLAVELAERRGDDHPLYLWARHNAAIAFFRTGDLERAEIYSRQALERFPRHLDSFYTLTMIAAERGEWEKVLSLGKEYLELADFFDNNPDQAGVVINCTMKEGASIHLLMGHAHHAAKDYERMSSHYRRAHEISDVKWQAWWNAGTFHLDRSGDLDRSRHYLDLALRESPDEPDIWYMLAKLNKKLELPLEERRCLEKLVGLGSKAPVVLNRLSSLYIEDGDLEKALKILKDRLESDPADYHTLCSMGRIHKQLNRPELAIDALSKALEVNPQGAEPWLQLGEISLRLDRLDEARSFFNRLLHFPSFKIEGLLFLCEIELRQNRVSDFIAWCDMLLKELGLRRDIVIESMEDLVSILLDIHFSLRDKQGTGPQLRKLLRMLPVDLQSYLHDRIGTWAEDQESGRIEFMRKELQGILDHGRDTDSAMLH